MANVNSYLGTLMPWHDEHCQPIVDALYRDDPAEARQALARAVAARQAAAGFSADELRVLDYVLTDFEFTLATLALDDLQLAPEFARALAGLTDQPPVGTQSDIVQATLLISMIGVGARRGYMHATPAEVEALLERIPDELRTPNIWYYIVAWAYHHDNLHYLELAMERQTLEATGWLDDYFWLRTNLMYLLVDGRATRLDVEKTIRGYTHALHLDDFRNLFLDRCERHGLMDVELYALLNARAEELHGRPWVAPTQTRKTARAVQPG